MNKNYKYKKNKTKKCKNLNCNNQARYSLGDLCNSCWSKIYEAQLRKEIKPSFYYKRRKNG